MLSFVEDKDDTTLLYCLCSAETRCEVSGGDVITVQYRTGQHRTGGGGRGWVEV